MTYFTVDSPPSRVSRIAFFFTSGVLASLHGKNFVPITAPSAPRYIQSQMLSVGKRPLIETSKTKTVIISNGIIGGGRGAEDNETHPEQ